MSAPKDETIGDDVDIECPWCGESMYMADDGRYADAWTDCEHCDKRVKLRADYDITVTATPVKP
jgi:hypothetical protein